MNRNNDDDSNQRDTIRCQAFGCPLRGTMGDLNSNAFYCHCHHGIDLSRWAEITRGIRDHAWINDLGVDVRNDIGDKSWRRLATEYLKDHDAHLVPGADESRVAYLYRLHLELEWRVGVRSNRPGIQHPAGGGKFKRGNVSLPTFGRAVERAA